MTLYNAELHFIEVKSTTSNRAFFSRSEIIFAYENIGNYIVQIVKDNEIYDYDIKDDIEEIYEYITNGNLNWKIQGIELKLQFE